MNRSVPSAGGCQAWQGRAARGQELGVETGYAVGLCERLRSILRRIRGPRVHAEHHSMMACSCNIAAL